MRIDLHTHSTASDGTDTPAELVRNAGAAGLDVVALTDRRHNHGLAEASAALPEGLTLITGAELSCRLDGISMHVLAYLFDPEEPGLLAERRAGARRSRAARPGHGFSQAPGLGVAGRLGAGRAHRGRQMQVRATARGLRPGRAGGRGQRLQTPSRRTGWPTAAKACVPKHETDPFEAIRLVKAAGGVTVFAHPAAAKRGRTVPESAIADLAAAGLDGIEVDHMDHEPATRARLRGPRRRPGTARHRIQRLPRQPQTFVLGEFTTDPEVYGEITRRATGAFPVPGAGGV